MSARVLRAFVDRIEGDKAVLLIGDEEVETLVLPAKYLPEGAGEGSVLTVTIAVDPGATTEAAERVHDILRRLTDQL